MEPSANKKDIKGIFIITLIILSINCDVLHPHCLEDVIANWNIGSWETYEDLGLGVRFNYPPWYRVTKINNRAIINSENLYEYITIYSFSDDMISALRKLKEEYRRISSEIQAPIVKHGMFPVEWNKDQLIANQGVYWVRVVYPITQGSHTLIATSLITEMRNSGTEEQSKIHKIVRIDVKALWPEAWNVRSSHCEEPITLPQGIANTVTLMHPQDM